MTDVSSLQCFIVKVAGGKKKTCVNVNRLECRVDRAVPGGSDRRRPLIAPGLHCLLKPLIGQKRQFNFTSCPPSFVISSKAVHSTER